MGTVCGLKEDVDGVRAKDGPRARDRCGRRLLDAWPQG